MDNPETNNNPNNTPEIASAPEPVQAPEPAPEPTPQPTPEVASEPTSESVPEVAPITSATVAKAERPKAKKAKVIIYAVAASTVVVAMVVILVIQLFDVLGPFGGKDSLYEHNAYFLPESTKTNTKYALVDKDGKVLTEYNIEKFDAFVDGYTIVKTTEGWGIMDDTGHMTVKPNEYDGLSRVGGLYTALKPGSSERKLLHGSGREVTSYSSSLNSDLGSDNYYGGKSAFAIAIKRSEKEYDIYNARGKKLMSIESEKAPIISSASSGYGEQGTVTSVSYSGGIIVFRNNNLEEMIRTTDSYDVYQLLYVSMDGSQLVFSEIKDESKKGDDYIVYDDYDPSYSRYYTKNANHAIYTGGKFREIGNNCRSISIVDSEDVPTGYISCTSAKDGSGFYSSDGAFHKMYDSVSRTNYVVIDASHYAVMSSGSNAKVSINGRSISQAMSISKAKNNFIVRANNSQMQIYDKDGKQICSSSSLTNFGGFDKNGVAVVYLNKSSYDPLTNISSFNFQYYLMNQSCSNVSAAYSSISAVGNYYSAIKRNQSESTLSGGPEIELLNAEGKSQLSDDNISSISTVSYRGNARNMIVVRRSDGKNTLYSDKLEKIIDYEGSILYDNNQDMVKVYGEKFINFYTPEGVELGSIPIGEGARSRT